LCCVINANDRPFCSLSLILLSVVATWADFESHGLFRSLIQYHNHNLRRYTGLTLVVAHGWRWLELFFTTFFCSII
jgi:hypothetical protein